MHHFFSLIIIFLLTACTHKHDINYAIKEIQKLERKSSSYIGVSAVHMESGRALNYREKERFQMASTVKVPIAIYLLHLAENKKINLDKMISIEPQDLVLGSGLMGYFLSRPGLSISIYNMFEPMVAVSDNSATDIILKQIGGPKAVYDFLCQNNLDDIRVNRTIDQIYLDSSGVGSWPLQNKLTLLERRALINMVPMLDKMKAHKDFYNDSKDTTTPEAMTHLLVKLYKGELLNPQYSEQLLNVMSNNSHSRIKKVLSIGTKTSSKTGTWWDDVEDKRYNYTNEIALITLPTGEHIALSIYTKSENSSLERQVAALEGITKVLLKWKEN